MLVALDDIETLKQLIAREWAAGLVWSTEHGGFRAPNYDPTNDRVDPYAQFYLIRDRPHLMMVLGYDEFRQYHLSEHVRMLREFYSEKEGSNDAFYSDLALTHPDGLGSAYRDSASGAWYWYWSFMADKVLLFGCDHKSGRSHQASDWLEILTQLYEKPDDKRRVFWPATLWTPRIQSEQKTLLAESVGCLIDAVYVEQKELRDIPWRQLEEMVAELLRSRGLQIHVTPRSGDGGRDIIARGELIPGEPMLLAVEVKQKPVVGIADVRNALWANKDFGAVMIATAGRFSGGVIQEKERNQLRLFLKDGVALTQWINAYKAHGG
jgi:hypothetical protein